MLEPLPPATIASINLDQPNGTQIKLRQATQSDLPLLIELYAAMDGEAPLSSETAEVVFEQMQQVPDYAIYLVSWEETVVGTFSLLVAPTFMHRGFHRFALLDSVTILPNYRGQGLGKAMVQAALQIGRTQGCYKLMLSSNLKRDRAHEFYQSLGFDQHGWSFSLKL